MHGDVAPACVHRHIHRAGAVQPQQRAVRQQELAAFARAHAVVGQISGHHLLNRQDAPGQYTAPAHQRHRAQAAAQDGASPSKVMIGAV